MEILKQKAHFLHFFFLFPFFQNTKFPEGAFSVPVAPFWPSSGPPGVPWGALGLPLGCLWAPWGSLLGPLWSPWDTLGPPSAPLGRLLAPWGSLMGLFWSPWDTLGPFSAPSVQPKSQDGSQKIKKRPAFPLARRQGKVKGLTISHTPCGA